MRLDRHAAKKSAVAPAGCEGASSGSSVSGSTGVTLTDTSEPCAMRNCIRTMTPRDHIWCFGCFHFTHESPHLNTCLGRRDDRRPRNRLPGGEKSSLRYQYLQGIVQHHERPAATSNLQHFETTACKAAPVPVPLAPEPCCCPSGAASDETPMAFRRARLRRARHPPTPREFTKGGLVKGCLDIIIL